MNILRPCNHWNSNLPWEGSVNGLYLKPNTCLNLFLVNWRGISSSVAVPLRHLQKVLPSSTAEAFLPLRDLHYGDQQLNHIAFLNLTETHICKFNYFLSFQFEGH